MSAFDPREWQAQVRGERCALCAPGDAARLQRGWIASLDSVHVHLQDDDAFVGYCVLVHRRHVVELLELSASEQRELIGDVARVSEVLQEATRPLKLNYAMLGNLVPHLHVHVIPRFAADGWWGQSPWARPDDRKRALSPEAFDALRSKLRTALGA